MSLFCRVKVLEYFIFYTISMSDVIVSGVEPLEGREGKIFDR